MEFSMNFTFTDAIKEEKCFLKIIKHLGRPMLKNYKIHEFWHLTMQLEWLLRLICATRFIMHICQLLLGKFVDDSVDTKNAGSLKSLKSRFLASDSVLAYWIYIMVGSTRFKN